MSTFDELMAEADAVLFAESAFGTSGSYQLVSGGDPIPMTVIVDHQIEPRPDDTEYRVLAELVELHIRASDITQPRRGDTFTAGAAVYTIDHVSRSDAAGLVNIARARVAP